MEWWTKKITLHKADLHLRQSIIEYVFVLYNIIHKLRYSLSELWGTRDIVDTVLYTVHTTILSDYND